MKMSNKVYDALKWIVMIVLPSLGTFYLVLSGIWGLPYGEQISGTIGAVEVLLGSCMMLSSAKYNKSMKSVE